MQGVGDAGLLLLARDLPIEIGRDPEEIRGPWSRFG